MIPETNKKPGVCYAVSDDGLELPVVDITHPAFDSIPSPTELESIREETLRNLKLARWVPRFVIDRMARRSIVMRGTLQASGGFLSGMATYLQKVGPDNLGAGYAGDADRKLLRSLAPVAVRLRLRQLARAMAGALAPRLATGAVPLSLLNIAGGIASDSLNTLLLLHREHPESLTGRPIRIEVLDIDEAGPRFGRRALAALRVAGAPLAGLDIRFEHRRASWNDTGTLREALEQVGQGGAVVAASSEGGLLEYGSDEEIATTLSALREWAPGETIFWGSVARDVDMMRVMKRSGNLAIRPRHPESLAPIAERAGWSLEVLPEPNPLYVLVRLNPA